MTLRVIEEAIYIKCILDDERYKETSLQELVKQLAQLFLQAINYKG